MAQTNIISLLPQIYQPFIGLVKKFNAKKVTLVITLVVLLVKVNAQPKIDTVAVFLFDKMSTMIKDLLSCSVSIKSMYDINSMEFGLVKHSDEHELFLHGSSKLLVRSKVDKGTLYLSFTGDTLTYYSQDQYQYG